MKALFFTSNYCPSCRKMEPVIKKLQGEGFAIEVIDTRSNSELAGKYSVNAIPTLIILSNGQEIKRWVGVVSEENIKSIFKKQNDYRIW